MKTNSHTTNAGLLRRAFTFLLRTRAMGRFTTLLLALGALAFAPLASAQQVPIDKLADFDGAATGSQPRHLIRGSDGDFYGLTNTGGAYNNGTAFKVTVDGVVTKLADFEEYSTGGYPAGRLVQAIDGNFYGLTSIGGVYGDGSTFTGDGTFFKMTPTGELTVLAEFRENTTGGRPQGSLVLGSDGDFYGLTYTGGANQEGTAFKVTMAGVLTKLADFNRLTIGSNPQGDLVQVSGGDFYGVANGGGLTGSGTAFKMTPAGVVTKLADFDSFVTGGNPSGHLLLGSDGDFYGLTGGFGHTGTAYKLTMAGVLTKLADFDQYTTGVRPFGSLVEASDGNFYGMTSEGGSYDGTGAVFQLTPSGTVTVLATALDEYSGAYYGATIPGKGLFGDLIPTGDGNFLGLSRSGGTNNAGILFRVNTGMFPAAGFFAGGNGRYIVPGATTTRAADGTKMTGYPNLPVAQTFTLENRTTSAVTVSSVEISGLEAGSFTLGTLALPAVLAAGETLDFSVSFQSASAGAAATATVLSDAASSSYSFAVSGRVELLRKVTDYAEVLHGAQGTLVRGNDGDFYGVAAYYGATYDGAAYKVTAAGVVTKLADFDAASGTRPLAGLVLGTDGDFYGVAGSGGNNDFGTAFKVTTAGVLTRLVAFDANAAHPFGSLLLGSDGDFYGLATDGGEVGVGAVFKLTAAGVVTTLGNFNSSTGFNPRGDLVLGNDGNLYGEASGGGANGSGTFFVLYAGLGGGVDTTPPVTTITSGPGHFTFSNSSSATFTFTGSDDVTPAAGLTWTGYLDAGDSVPITSPVTFTGLPDGLHYFSHRATDAAGNVEPIQQRTWLVDTTPPVLSLPGPITVAATGPDGAVVTYTASASDAVILRDSSFTPASGSLFPVGTTTVVANALDFAGNTVTGSFTVTVQALMPGTLAFANATPSANPVNGSGALNTVPVLITRSGGTAGAITVEVVPSQPATTPSGFAKYVYGTDYQFVNGTVAGSTVSFADGQASATVDVLLKTPVLTKKGQLKLTLASTTGGAAIGSPAAATLTINARDTVAPTLVLNTPVAGAAFDITGTVKDAGGLASLTVKVNGATLPLTVDPVTGYVANAIAPYSVLGAIAENGANVILVTAKDLSGNTSTMTKTVTYLNNRPALTGTYTALIKPTGTPDGDTTGFLTATLSVAGKITGKVTLSGVTIAFTGLLNNAGVATFGTTNAASLDLIDSTEFDAYLGALAFSVSTPDGLVGVLTTRASGGTVLATCAGTKAPYSSTNLVPAGLLTTATKGTYTVAFPSKEQSPVLTASAYPQGDGYATLTLTNAGTITVLGKLADGTPLSASGNLRADGTLPLFATLYKKLGLVAGELTFADLANSDLSGSDLIWIRPNQRTARYYRFGWETGIRIDAVGAKYITPAALDFGQGAVEIVNGNAALVFTDGQLASTITRNVNVAPTTGAVTLIPATGAPYKLTLTAGTGVFSGTFTHGADTDTYRGVLINKGANKGGFGYFLSTVPLIYGASGESGGVSLQP